MKHVLHTFVTMLACTVTSYAADDVASAVAGTVKKVDSGTRTLVVKTDDGAERTFHFSQDLAVHGAKATGKTSSELVKGIKDGSQVAVHYTIEGSRETAHEIDVAGDGGIKVTRGTVTGIDRSSRFLAIKTDNGAQESFRLTGRAVDDSGKGIVEGIEQSAHVTIFYTEHAGKKVAHYFG